MFCRIPVILCSILVIAVNSEDALARRVTRSSLHLSFEQLLYSDTDATLIWNFTEKYNILENKDNLISNNTHLNCVEELNIDHELIGPYLVNLTLNNVSFFLHDVTFHHIHGTKLSQAEEIKVNITQVTQDDEMYFAAVEKTRQKLQQDKDKDLICLKNSNCACVSLSDLEQYQAERYNLIEKGKLISNFILFGYQIVPPITVIVIIIGIVLNSALLVTLIKEESVRTESNISIFNLLINNFIILFVYTPLQYVHKYHHYNMYIEYSFHILELIVISVNVFAVLIVSVQRYFDVSRILKPNIDGCRLSPTARCCIYSTSIWIPSIAITAFICSEDNYLTIHRLQTILYLFIYLLFVAILLVLFNSLTGRKLERAVKHGQISLENETITSSTVVLAITVSYYLIFTPFFIYLPFEKFNGETDFRYYYSTNRRVFSLIFHAIFSLHPSIIVLALYKSSSTFRKYLRKYLFPCWLESGEEKYVTMSSLKHDES